MLHSVTNLTIIRYVHIKKFGVNIIKKQLFVKTQINAMKSFANINMKIYCSNEMHQTLTDHENSEKDIQWIIKEYENLEMSMNENIINDDYLDSFCRKYEK